MVGGVGLGLELAEELGQLAPFGMGNPGVRLMVPSARVSDVRTMGEGKHARFSLHSGAHRALGVAFGRSVARRRGRGPGRRRGAARGQPLERLGRAARRPARALPAGGPTDAGPPRARLRVRGCRVVDALRGRAAARLAAPVCRFLRPGSPGRSQIGPCDVDPRRRLGDGRDRRARLQRRRGAGGLRRRFAPGGPGDRASGLARFNGGAGRARLSAAAARRSLA